MEDFNWICPHCEHAVTISDERCSNSNHILWIANADGRRSFVSRFFVCPNPKCGKFTLTAALWQSHRDKGEEVFDGEIERWNLVPDSKAKTFPNYIPQVILDDYKEACLIRDLSPKASATLSRRCLQGILRDFWAVKPGRLFDEIDEIKPKIDQPTWDAIDAVRKLGNIGAHMEKDINVIVDVDPDEAELLLGLIETLLRDWYVARQEKMSRMAAIVAAAAAKKSP